METLAMVSQLVTLGVTLAPEIKSAVNLIMDNSGSGQALTVDQQHTITEGLKAAHAALQAAQQGDQPS